jgi:exodeoxyribonuclease VII large subunit
MQGDRVEGSIIEALDSIAAESDQWDVVVIIRGGGATSDLSGFDTYLLAANCAQFPLPIITGIGHERDDTVLDVVAHTRVKTPTAAAEYLIARLVDAADRLSELVDTLSASVTQRMHREENRLTQLAARLPSLLTLVNTRQHHRIEHLEQRMHAALKQTLVTQTYRLELMEKIIQGASPQLILQRGYTITRCEGKVVRDAASLAKGSILTTEFADGKVQSEVIH